MSKQIIFALILLIGLPALTLAQAPTPAPAPAPAPRTNVGRMTGDLGCYASIREGVATEDLIVTTPNAAGTLKLGPAVAYYICIATRYISVIAVFIIIIVGIMYMLGGIKPETSSIAKTIIVTTLTGLVFMYLTSFIINLLVIGGILGRAT